MVLRILLAFAVTHGYEVFQADFDGAYLNANLDTPVYMSQPTSCPPDLDPNGRPCIWCLRKALHGLKQAGRLWYLLLRQYLVSQGFRCLDTDQCVFLLEEGDSLLVCWVYVDESTWEVSVMTQRSKSASLTG